MNTAASRRWIFIIVRWVLPIAAFLLFLAGCSTGKQASTANPASNNDPSANAPAATGPEGTTGGGLLPRRLKVVGKSMEPAIKEQETLSYKAVKYAELQRGDIIVFKKEDNLGIRRLIGLPGQTVEIKDGVVYINGQAITAAYLALPQTENFGIVTLANDEYFVLCDKPDARQDSRAYGPIKAADVLGRANVK